MKAETVRVDTRHQSLSVASESFAGRSPVGSTDIGPLGPQSGETIDLARAADYILDDCLFAMGQVVGTRTTIDFDSVMWLRDQYREKFIRAMRTFGDRWQADRHNVTSVAFMLGERAVRYAANRQSIDLDAVKKASADVERFCRLHSKRQAKARGLATSGSDQPLIAGYWCTN